MSCRRSPVCWQASGDAGRRVGVSARRRTSGFRPASPTPQRSSPGPPAGDASGVRRPASRRRAPPVRLPYRERRALLEELALDGPAWRTPASVAVDRAEDFVSRVAELGLEGVVAKRLELDLPPRGAQPRMDQAQASPRGAPRGHRPATLARWQSRGGVRRPQAPGWLIHRRRIDRARTSRRPRPRARAPLGRAPRSPPRRDRLVSGRGVSDRVCSRVTGRPVRDAVLREIVAR